LSAAGLGAVARGSPHDMPSERAARQSSNFFGRPSIRYEDPGEVANAGRAGARRTTQVATDVPDTNELIDEGIAAERLGMLDRAESCYSLAAASEHPDVRARALTKLAGVHRSRAEWDTALELARRAQDVARDSDQRAILD